MPEACVLRPSAVSVLRKVIITPTYTTCPPKSAGASPRARQNRWLQLRRLTARTVSEYRIFHADSERLNLELLRGWRRCCLATAADAEHTRAWCDILSASLPSNLQHGASAFPLLLI
jgi:hypothetical protein|eukprot:COSAG02_NODE_421_length_22605_cov_158.841198_6_plen_117_part_00